MFFFVQFFFQIWIHINNLENKEINIFEYCNIYNYDGEIIKEEDIKDEIETFWDQFINNMKIKL